MGWRGGVFGAVAASRADPVILCFETVRAAFDRAWAGGVGWWGLVGIGGRWWWEMVGVGGVWWGLVGLGGGWRRLRRC